MDSAARDANDLALAGAEKPVVKKAENLQGEETTTTKQ